MASGRRSSHEVVLYCAITDGDLETTTAILKQHVDLVNHFSDSLTDTPMIVAACYGQDDIIELLMKRKCTTLDAPDMMGQTPLHCAAARGYLSTVKRLLSLGSKALDVFDVLGNTPLHLATHPRNTDVLIFLIERGCAVDIHPGNNKTPFHTAIFHSNLTGAQRLLDAGSKAVNMVYGGRSTLLGYARNKNLKEVCDFLVENGANETVASQRYIKRFGLLRERTRETYS